MLARPLFGQYNTKMGDTEKRRSSLDRDGGEYGMSAS